LKLKPQKIDNDLYLIALPVAMDGFDSFITSWAYTGGPVVIADVGPSVTACDLLDALLELGVDQPDYILLTHIHLDHAGGVGQIAAAYPNTPVVCHPKAIEHLIEPQKLWEGSLKTLGDVARRYGPMMPVERAQVRAADQFQMPEIIAIPTPGHAPHHFSYQIDDLLFAGEVGGVCIALDDGGIYMRPATPPRFFMETYLESIDRVLAHHPKRICYGHFGMHTGDRQTLQKYRDQLLSWQQWIKPWYQADPENRENTTQTCLEDLLAKDPLLENFKKLSKPDQSRERFFLLNSVKGYWGYLQTIGDNL